MKRCPLLLTAFLCVTAVGVAQAQTFPDDQPFASFWFPNDLLTWDPADDPDAPYNKSAIPLQSRFRNPAAQVNPQARPDEARVMAASIMNPSTSNNPSQGSLTFDRYAFNYWQYLDFLVFWGGSAGEGLILAPNSEVIDAAHKNGVPVLGTIFLPPNAFGGQLSWVQDLVQRQGDTYPVGDKLIEVAEYYGFDGWFFNQETSGADAALALEYRNFLRYLQANSSLHFQWYDSMIESGPIWWQGALNENNDGYFQESSRAPRASDGMFVDFRWS
ncbi:MAG: glycoside hydrolase, partial [Acidobacteriota bacterium]